MPVNPDDAAAFVRDPQFQSIGDPAAKLAAFRSYLSKNDAEFDQLEQADPIAAAGQAKQVLDYHQPGWLENAATTAGNVAEYVPVVGGAVRGARGEPVRPLTKALSLGYEAPAGLPRAIQESGRDLAELAAVTGVTKLASPLIEGAVGRLAGGVLESTAAAPGIAAGRVATQETGLGVANLVERALTNEGAFSAIKPIAGDVARVALRQRLAHAAIEQATAGTAFATLDALEHEIATGSPPPLGEFVGTALGTAALGMGFYGLGELATKFRVRSAADLADTIAQADPEHLAGKQAEIAKIIDATAQAGRLDRTAARDLVFDALTKPIAEVGDQQVLKDALKRNPELLGTETGLHLLRTQRAIVEPDVHVTDGEHLRVTYDDETGKSVTQDMTGDAGAQRAFAKRVADGRITIDNAAGDQASILRAGIRAGEPLAERIAPGGGPARLVGEAQPPVGDLAVSGQLPALRPAIEPPDPGVLQLHDLVAGASRDLRTRPDLRLLPPPEGEVADVAGVGTRRILEGPPPAPPAGTTARSSAGADVRVMGEADPSGRATVELPSGHQVRAQWNGYVSHFEVPPSLLTLPERLVGAPALTREAAVPPITSDFRKQVAAGQVIHQTPTDLAKRGARPSLEVLRVEGNNVVVRSGYEDARVVPIDAVADTIESGASKFAFDMTKAPTDILETMNERFSQPVREPRTADVPTTPESISRDAQTADEVWAFRRQQGQDVGPATTARNEGDGLAAKREARQRRPADERTKSKSDLVKGCK